MITNDVFNKARDTRENGSMSQDLNKDSKKETGAVGILKIIIISK